MASIELEAQTLPQLREIARLRYFPELADAAGAELLSRMVRIVEDVRSIPRTNYLGREHFDAFAAVKHTLYNRQDSGRLFNHLVSPDSYGFRESMYARTRRTPQRVLFGLFAHEINDILVIAPRNATELGLYPDEKPSGTLSSTINQTSHRAIEMAIGAGSYIDLVEYGQQHKAQTQPKKPLNLEERFAIEFAEHVA